MEVRKTLIGLLLFIGIAVGIRSIRNKNVVRRPFDVPQLTQKSQEQGLGMWGGTNTNITQNPWVVGIIRNGSFTGQGCIISTRWVLSTGDNFADMPVYYFEVITGSNNGITGEKHQVQVIYPHPDYDASIYECDFALAKTKSKFTWSTTVKPINLPTRRPKVNSMLSVAGWGQTGSKPQNTVFKEGQLKWIDKSICPTLIWDVRFDYSLGCAYNKGKATLCEGDYGDAFVQNGSVYGLYITGTVGGWCSSEAGAEVLADVFGVVGWIKQTMKEFLEE